MSWLRSAVKKAVEVGGINTRTVRNYAGLALAGGARIIQNHMGIQNSQNFKQTVERLENTAASCRGVERVQLLETWLFALREVGRKFGSLIDQKKLEQPISSEESNSSSGNVSLVLYCDSQVGDEPMNFRNVFLYSQALEGIILSMIIEAPNEAEISLLLQIFGHCLTGGKEVHDAIIRNIQDLSKAFSTYEEQVLVKREELLQFAQVAISGLKLNADLVRLEYEVSKLQKKVNEMEALRVSLGEDQIRTEKTASALVEVLKEALTEIRLCSRLETLLLKKKNTRCGETLDKHSQKVDKLKVLAESLANSSLKAEKRILDNRNQKEETLNFRVAKANETRGVEKDLLSDIARLENQREGLEAELKKVNSSLIAACARLKKTREEKDQFDEASDQIIMQLKAKDDELAKSIASCKVEADIVHVWINFLEDTWKLQSSCRELNDKQNSDELEKYGNLFVKLIKFHLSSCKDDLKSSIAQISTLVEHLKRLSDRGLEATEISKIEMTKPSKPRRYLEEEYLATETKILTAFSIVDHMEELFYTERERGFRRDDPEVNQLFESVEKMRLEFESIERPSLKIDIPEQKLLQLQEKSQNGHLFTPQFTSSKSKDIGSPKSKAIGSPNSSPSSPDYISDPESEITKMELEFGNASNHYQCDELEGWEFD